MAPYQVTGQAAATATRWPHVRGVVVSRRHRNGFQRPWCGRFVARIQETLITIAANPKHLGARIGITSVLHTWGSAMTHHPHVHMIVPGGGIAPDSEHWVSCRL